MRVSNGSRSQHDGESFDLQGVRTVPQGDPQGMAQKLPPRKHMFDLPEAPIFYPSAEEFQDPLAYIQKIRPQAENAGLCKIVPPAGWNPPFALDTKRFRFRTRIQQLNSLEGKTRTNLNYLDQLYKFHAQQGQPLTKVPQLDHRPIDLFGLRHEVAVRGGYQKVNGEKRWAEIGRVMKYDRKTCTSMSNSLKSTYQKIILPFELYQAKHGSGSLSAAAEDGNSRRSKRQRSAARSDSPATPALPPAAPAQETVASPSAVSAAEDSKRTASLETIPDACEVCGSGENDSELLICDGCDRGFHMYCLSPALSAIPTNDWYCDACVLGAGADFGFEDGSEYTLASFKRKSDEFKRQMFGEYYEKQAAGYLAGPQMEGRVPEDVVESEFWRLVASPYEDVEVEYGADLHSAQHGSGFPTAERAPLDPYAKHPWNLNELPFQRESLFNYIRQDISGMMTPWIYVGMCFSTFCWHNEDHYTYSVNYQHWGDTKTWYGVPGRHADMFEDAMRAAVPELFADQPDLLFQLVTMLSPDVLLRRGVEVVTCDQRAGEFVVTFPQSYHAGFNQGFNFNEAVNFATPDWMPFDISSVKRYRQYARSPVFSHDELLMTMCEADAKYLLLPWFQRAAAEMLVRERSDRARVRAMWPASGALQRRMREAAWDDVALGESDIPEDMRQQCVVCKAFSFLSAVVCDCSPTYVSCLLHAEKACKCNGHHKTLLLRYTDSELSSMFDLCRDQYQPEPEPEAELADCARSDSKGTASSSHRSSHDSGHNNSSSNGNSSNSSSSNNNNNSNSSSNVNSKAKVWEDEFRRVMSLYSADTPASATVASGTTAQDGDIDTLSTATRTVSEELDEVPYKQDEKIPSLPKEISPTGRVQGTMTVADLNRRPDLAQMVLLLEEAQRLVVGETLRLHADDEAVLESVMPMRSGRGRGRGQRGRSRGRPPNITSVRLLSGSVNTSENAAEALAVGKEIEQLVATMSNSTAVDTHILGDVRQLARFVQRAQEWCCAAQALLTCMGQIAAVERVVAKNTASYAWHRQQLQRRFAELLDPSLMSPPPSAVVAEPLATGSTVGSWSEAVEDGSEGEQEYAGTSSTSSSEPTEDEDDDTFVMRRPVGRPPKNPAARRGRYIAVRRPRGGRVGRPRGGGRGQRRPVGRPPKSQQVALRPPPRPEAPEPPARRLRSRNELSPVSEPSSPPHSTRQNSARKPSAFGQSLVANLRPAELVSAVEHVLYDGQRAPTSNEVRHRQDVPWCPFGVNDLSALLRMGEELFFAAPEFEALIEWELTALEAERQAKAVMDNAAAAIQRQAAGVTDQQQDAFRRQVTVAMGSLRSVGLLFPQMQETKRIERALDWCAEARQRLNERTLSAEFLTRLIEQAGRLDLNNDIPLVARLEAAKHEVDQWDQDAASIISSHQPIDLRVVAKLLEKGRNLDVQPLRFSELQDMQQMALDLQARTDKIIERSECAELVKRPRYEEAAELADACSEFGRFEPSNFGRLREVLAKADSWNTQVLHVFVPVSDISTLSSSVASPQLDAHLETVQYRLRRALALAKGSSSHEKPAEASQQSPRTPTADVYCVCLRPEEGLMIECDHCKEWYHAQCLNLGPADIGQRQFLCPLCIATAKNDKVQLLEDYPTVSRISRAVEEGRMLELVARTLDPLVTILLDARALAPAIRHVLDNKQLVGKHPRSMSTEQPPTDPAAEQKQGRELLLRALLRGLLGLGVNLKQGLLDDLWAELQQGASSRPPPSMVSSAVVAAKHTNGSSMAVRQQVEEPMASAPSPPVLDNAYQQQLEELVYLVANPPAEDHGQGLPAASSMFKAHDENCVCNMYGVDLANNAGMAAEPAISCDGCHEPFHINCVQVPPAAARVVLLHQMQRMLNANIDANIPQEPNTYICPGCCVKAGMLYPYGEVVFE
ncbi:hypothetical protein IWW40_000621 [Coemansia sp. RSA 1250]|nr:hypothetical protein IWW40_000621 [Coemansia sp. RSA 1250]